MTNVVETSPEGADGAAEGPTIWSGDRHEQNKQQLVRVSQSLQWHLLSSTTCTFMCRWMLFPFMFRAANKSRAVIHVMAGKYSDYRKQCVLYKLFTNYANF